jgi:hypothetical protein
LRDSEAAVTVTTTSDIDFELAQNFELAQISGELITEAGNTDPMVMIDQLPEVRVPVASLMPGFHLRQDGTDADHVRLLADAAGSARLPSILVQKRGSRVIDGMHRLEVAKLRGEWGISARIVDCTDEEALVLAVKSNTLHGLPLTRADRIASAKRILTAHADWSDRSVAGITGLSAKAIASIRNSTAGPVPFNGKRLGRDGKRRPVTPGEGRRRAAEYITAHPEASLREVARETDVSLGTVHDVRERLRRGEESVPDRPVNPIGHVRPAPAGPHPAGPAGPSPAGPAGPAPAGQAPVRPAPGRPVPSSGRPAPDRAAPDRAAPDRGASPIRTIHPAGGAGARGVPRLAWPALSGKLAGDPALRYTEGGRAFLRWMSMHSMQADEWREFIDAIPQHWLEEVGRMAVSMSEEWRQFAERLGSKLEAVG